MIRIFKYGMILLFIFSTSIYSQYILRVENNQVIIQGSLRSQFEQYDEIYVKGIRDYKLVNIGILRILDFQGDSTIASIIDTFKNQKILKNDFILRRYDERIDHNAFGIEFWALKSHHLKEAIKEKMLFLMVKYVKPRNVYPTILNLNNKILILSSRQVTNLMI